MRNRRLILLLIVAAMLTRLFLWPFSAHAQTPVCSTYNFLSSPSGWQMASGSGFYVTGEGFHPHANTFVAIQYIAASSTIYSISWTYYSLVGHTGDGSSLYANGSTLQDHVSPGAGEQVFTWTGSVPANDFVITIGSDDEADAIRSVTLCGNSDPAGQPPPPASANFTNCPLLGIANANFASLPGNWTLIGDAAQASGGTSGLQFGIGSASLTISLNPMRQYILSVTYDNPNADAAEFNIGLGGNPSYFVSAPANTTGTATFPAANYNPGSPGGNNRESQDSTPDLSGPNFYTLLLERNQAIPDAVDRDGNPVGADPIIIKSVCITDNDPNAVGGGTGGPGGLDGTTATSVPADCGAGCTFHFEGDTGSILGILAAIPSILQGLFSYLLCGLLTWFRCVLAPALGGIWTTIMNIFLGLNLARQWFGLVWQNGTGWLSGVLHIISLFFRGSLDNLLQIALNAVAITLNNLGIMNIINGALAFIQSLIQGAGNVLTFVSGLLQGIGSIIGLIVSFLLNVVVARFIELIQTIVNIFASLISVVNVTAVAPPGVPVCDTSASMIPASCVGLFIIDNSVLADGSIIGTALPLIQGAAGLGVLWWSINRIKRAISNYAEAD